MKKVMTILLILTFLLTSCEYAEVTGDAILNTLDEVSIDIEERYEIPQDTNIKLASFNIQILGKSKINKDLPKEYLPKIIREYDIIAIQELRDSSTTTINTLKEWLPEYQFVISERLGRSSSKEQYIIAYRVGQIISSEVWTDTDDIFEREPQITYMKVGDLDFSLINNHIKPDDAENEIKALQEVINYAILSNNDEDFILVGDLNADCSYYDEDLPPLKQYNWIIDNNKDTTVSKNTCTYDRIITNMNLGDSGVNNYQQSYSLSYEDAKIISDHYPVWVQLN